MWLALEELPQQLFTLECNFAALGMEKNHSPPSQTPHEWSLYHLQKYVRNFLSLINVTIHRRERGEDSVGEEQLCGRCFWCLAQTPAFLGWRIHLSSPSNFLERLALSLRQSPHQICLGDHNSLRPQLQGHGQSQADAGALKPRLPCLCVTTSVAQSLLQGLPWN